MYLNFLDQVNQRVKSHGKQMMFWGDVILHQPDLIAELPAGLIALEWGYEANHPFDKEGEAFKKPVFPIMFAPAHPVGIASVGELLMRLRTCARQQRAGFVMAQLGILTPIGVITGICNIYRLVILVLRPGRLLAGAWNPTGI